MAWSFVGVGTAVTVTATAHALTEPAGCQAGDLLVAVISSRIASTTSITLPAGWTLVAESKTNNVVAAAVTSEASGMMAYIVRGDTAPALTFTHPAAPSVAMGRIVAYRGGNIWSPFDVGIGAKTGTSITAVSTTGLTTGEANELIVKGVCSGRASAFSAHDAATDPTTSSATGAIQTAAPIVGTWQERQDATTTTGADTALAIADAIRGTAGATGALTCTASVSGGHAQVAGAFRIEPIATPGSSTIAKTGSTLDFVGTDTNSGTVSSTITVPSDAQIVVVGMQGWCGEADYFTSMTFTKGGADTAMTRVGTTEPGNGQTAAIFYLVLPDTGSNKSLKYDWAGTNAPGEIPIISVTFWKGIDTASPVRSSGASLPAVSNAAFKTRSALLTAQNGDLVVAFVGGDTGGNAEHTVDTWYNLNTVSQCVNGAATRHDGAWGSFAPSANIYVGADTSSGMQYGVCAAIVLKPTPAPASPITLVEFKHNNITATSVTSGNFAATQAGDVLIVAGAANGACSSPQFKTNNNDIGVFGTLGGVTSPVNSPSNGNRRNFVGMIANPTVGSINVTFSATESNLKCIGVWVLRGMTNPTQDKGVWTALSPDPVSVSGLTGTLADQYEFAISQAQPPNTVSGVNTGQTGSAGFVLDALISNFDSGFSHQLTVTTGSIQAAWDSTSGGADVSLATYYSGAAGVTGTLADTEDADIAAVNATVRWVATLAAPETVDVLASVGTVRWAATLAETEDPDIAALTGIVRWSATLAETEDPDVAAFLGTTRWQATLAVTEGADTALFNGTVKDPIDAALATTEAADVGAFTATVVSPALGDLATTEAPDVAAFLGSGNAFGPLATIEAPDIAALLGTTRWLATLATVEAPDVALINGTTRWLATLATTEAVDTAALTGTVRWSAALATTEAPDVAAFTGTARWQATLATTEAPDVGAFTGTIRWAATLATTEAADAVSFLGGIFGAGALVTTEAPDGAAFTGTAVTLGTLGAIEPGDTAAFLGGIYGAGNLFVIEAADTYAGFGTVGDALSALLSTREAADGAAFTGQITGVAGTLAATEAPDLAALTASVRWAAILAASELPDVAAFTGTVRNLATLATTEAPDLAAFVGQFVSTGTLATREAADSASFTSDIVNTGPLVTVEPPDSATILGTTRWLATLAATEAPDIAALTATVRSLGTLATTEAPDALAFSGQLGLAGTLATGEAPDLAAFNAAIISSGILDTTEAPDVAAFTSAPIDIAEVPGRILASAQRRVRSLASHEPRLRTLAPTHSPTRDLARAAKRVRSLKYPIPRTHMLVKMLNTQTTGE